MRRALALPKQTLLYLIKFDKIRRRLRPYANASIVYSGQLYNMHKLIAMVECGNHVHVIVVALSARKHAIPPARAKQYVASLEYLASKLVTQEYGHVNIDAYTFVASAYKLTRGVYGLADIKTREKSQTIAWHNSPYLIRGSHTFSHKYYVACIPFDAPNTITA